MQSVDVAVVTGEFGRALDLARTMPDDVQRESGCVIGEDYPAPLVDLKESRAEAIARLVLSEGGRLVATGLAVGLIGALLVGLSAAKALA